LINENAFKNDFMKPKTYLLILAMFAATIAMAQVKPAKKNAQKATQSSVNSVSDLDSKVDRMIQLYDHLKVNIQDQQVKAEIQPLLSKMSQVIKEYNASKSLTGAKLQKSRKRLESKIEDVIKTHSGLKAKFGAIIGDCC
jgi:ribosomal protein S15P/S13E